MIVWVATVATMALTRKGRAMNDAVTWYAVYDTPDDSDYAGFATKAEAVAEASKYLAFASDGDSQVYVVPVRDDAQIDPPGDLWSLWDHLPSVPESAITWIHRTGRYAADADIVDDLRNLADGHDDDLGRVLTRAANEIERLRKGVVA